MILQLLSTSEKFVPSLKLACNLLMAAIMESSELDMSFGSKLAVERDGDTKL